MKSIGRLVGLYVVLLAAFTVSIIAVHAIPTSMVRENVSHSADIIEEEGIFRKILGFELFKIDNMTDCMMLNMNVNADSREPVKSAMLNEFAKDYSGRQGYFGMARATKHLAENGRESMPEQVGYGRYWHGYQLLLRPLLVFFDYAQIRIINFFCLFSLTVLVSVMMYRRYHWAYAAGLLVSLAVINFPIVPFAIQFSTCFYIAFLSMFAVMRFPALTKNVENSLMTFFVIGALTGFMDFLTTPQLTLGLPLLLCLIDLNDFKRWHYIICVGVSWLSGYALLWASKWLVAYLLTGINIFQSAVDSIELRVSNTVVVGGNAISMEELYEKTSRQLFNIVSPSIILAVLGIIIILGILHIVFRWKASQQYGYLLLVAGIVPVWYIFLKNHSLQHIFFTWRALLLSIYSVLLFVYFTIQPEKENE